MKLLSLVLTALMALALLVSTASAEPMPPPMSAARNAARTVGWEVARRNQLVQSVKVASCRSKGKNRIHCLVLDRGSTSLVATTCRVSVRAEVVGKVTKGALRGVSCHNERLHLLTAADAEAAMQLRAQELSAGREATITVSTRVSRTELLGSATWAPRGSMHDPQGELCAAELQATLTDDGAVQVGAEATQCSRFPPNP